MSNVSSSEKHKNSYEIVGFLDLASIKRLLDITLPTAEVRIYPGFKKHVQKRHPGVFEAYSQYISSIIEEPDYVGRNPKEPESVELIKRISEHLLLAIKLDPSGYLYLSSMYEMKNGEYKIQKRLKSGRLVPYQRAE